MVASTLVIIIEPCKSNQQRENQLWKNYNQLLYFCDVGRCDWLLMTFNQQKELELLNLAETGRCQVTFSKDVWMSANVTNRSDFAVRGSGPLKSERVCGWRRYRTETSEVSSIGPIRRDFIRKAFAEQPSRSTEVQVGRFKGSMPRTFIIRSCGDCFFSPLKDGICTGTPLPPVYRMEK